MQYLFCILIGYLVGCLNPSYFIGRLHGFDIREKGSGNAGASNTLILLGKLRGALCALFDIGKAVFVIWLMRTLFPEGDYVFAITGVSCILGHMFPFYMKFRGGKGLACLGGMILVYNWRVFLLMLAGEIVIALTTNYICFVPITASLLFPIVYAFIESEPVGAVILSIATAVILYKHVENIRRIRCGTEMRLSYLWNKEKESERLRENYKIDR